MTKRQSMLQKKLLKEQHRSIRKKKHLNRERVIEKRKRA